MTIDTINNTPEFREKQWANMNDYEREKYKKEMEEWAYLYPLTAAVLDNEKLTEEEAVRLVKLGNSRR